MTDIFEAVAAGDLRRVQELVKDDPGQAGARDEQCLSALTQAQYQGRDEIVAVLLEADPALDVFEAATVGRVKRVRELVEADPALTAAYSPDGFTALHLLSAFSDIPVAWFLVERGADVAAVARNPMRVMPLHSAAAARQLQIARLLVENGADVNAAQEAGFTPLHAAAQNGDLELARLLLEHGADPGRATEDGRLAADFATASGSGEVLDLLQRQEVG